MYAYICHIYGMVYVSISTAYVWWCAVLSQAVMSDSLQPHGL